MEEFTKIWKCFVEKICISVLNRRRNSSNDNNFPLLLPYPLQKKEKELKKKA